jgi:hypothetical protein
MCSQNRSKRVKANTDGFNAQQYPARKLIVNGTPPFPWDGTNVGLIPYSEAESGVNRHLADLAESGVSWKPVYDPSGHLLLQSPEPMAVDSSPEITSWPTNESIGIQNAIAGSPDASDPNCEWRYSAAENVAGVYGSVSQAEIGVRGPGVICTVPEGASFHHAVQLRGSASPSSAFSQNFPESEAGSPIGHPSIPCSSIGPLSNSAPEWPDHLNAGLHHAMQQNKVPYQTYGFTSHPQPRTDDVAHDMESLNISYQQVPFPGASGVEWCRDEFGYSYSPEPSLSGTTVSSCSGSEMPLLPTVSMARNDARYQLDHPDHHSQQLTQPWQEAFSTRSVSEPGSTPARHSFDQSQVIPTQRTPAQRSGDKDAFLVQCKLSGMSYREIKEKGRFPEAESTLRGRFRTLTKRKEYRVRKPEWQQDDVSRVPLTGHRKWEGPEGARR